MQIDRSCPFCGKKQLVFIVYGYPTEETIEKYHKDELVLGGCVFTKTSPLYSCLACKKAIPRDLMDYKSSKIT